MTTYTTRTTQITVLPKGKPLFDETTTTITINDEAAGEFLVIEQNTDDKGPQKIRIDPAEWPAIANAVAFMLTEIEKGNP